MNEIRVESSTRTKVSGDSFEHLLARPYDPTQTQTLPADVWAKLHHEAIGAVAQGRRNVALRRPNDVPLHAVLHFAAGLIAALCLISIVLWQTGRYPPISPYAAVMGLIISPFVWRMGTGVKIDPATQRD